MENILFHSKALDKSFTFEEWSDYLKSDPPKVVAKHKSYEFNIHDVCLTPDVPVNYVNDRWRLCVKTSLSPCGEWSNGVDIMGTTAGYGHAAFFVNPGEGFTTMELAVVDGLKHLKQWVMHEIDTHGKYNRSYDDKKQNPSAQMQLYQKILRFLEDKILEFSGRKAEQLELTFEW